VAIALTNFLNSTGGIPLVFGTLTSAGLTPASGELPPSMLGKAVSLSPHIVRAGRPLLARKAVRRRSALRMPKAIVVR
jgi:hypothetical protein